MGQILANSEGINVLKDFALVLVFVNWISIAQVVLFALKIIAKSPIYQCTANLIEIVEGCPVLMEFAYR